MVGRNWRKPGFEVEAMGVGNGVARIGSGLKWMYVVSRSALALRVQVEVRFRISSRGVFEWTRAEEMCVSRWVRQFFCAIRRLVHPA